MVLGFQPIWFLGPLARSGSTLDCYHAGCYRLGSAQGITIGPLGFRPSVNNNTPSALELNSESVARFSVVELLRELEWIGVRPDSQTNHSCNLVP